MEFIVTIQEPEIQVVYVATQGEQGVAGLIWIDAGWTDATDYVVDNALEHNGSSYRAFVAHTSSAATEPGGGVDWETVWKILAEKGEDGLPGTTVHNDTTGKQGGTTDEFFHLTEAQHAGIAAAPTAITALNPVASIGDIEWEIDQTLDVTGSAVQEVLFTGLDFTTYEYRLQGVIEASAPGNSFNLRWYSTEATAAAVVGTEYISTMFRRNPSEQSFIANLNHFWYGQTSSGRIQVNDWRFFRDADGYTRMWGIDAFQLYSTTLSNFMAFSSSWNNSTTALSTKIGIYHTAANFFNVGTMLNLWRRKL